VKGILGDRLNLDRKVAVVTISSTLLLMVDTYHQLTSVIAYDRLILYLVVPICIVILVFRERPGAYGFALGDWKLGLMLTAAGIVLVTPVLWFTARGGAMATYYRPQVGGLPWNTLLDLFGWEFFFRGFIFFSYFRRFGPDALWLQAVPFALAHIGKPEIEALSTIFGGFAFGWMAYRTRSFLYPFLLHWFVGSLAILLAAGLLG
jgi:membrane protease YdiL (CAAX protease family)